MTYIDLITKFLSDNISFEDFEVIFLDKFKEEPEFNDESEFKILDELFGAIDSYYPFDSELFDSEFDIGEQELKIQAKKTLDLLKLNNLLK